MIIITLFRSGESLSRVRDEKYKGKQGMNGGDGDENIMCERSLQQFFKC